MTQIAVLGTGRMGTAMTRRLLGVGVPVTVWNRTPSRTAESAEAGAVVAEQPHLAVAGATVVVTMLSDAEAVTTTLAAASSGMAPGTVVAEMSTIGPAAVRALATTLPEKVKLVDAPVIGSVPAARAGTLSILAGGDTATVDEIGPVLRSLGSVRHCGELGGGAAMKLVVNNAMIGSVTLLAETLALSDALGIDSRLTEAVLTESPLGKAIARRNATGAAFSIDLAAKDLRLALETARLPVTTAINDRLGAAAAGGWGDADLAALVTYIRSEPKGSTIADNL